ncbi:Meiotic recombination protein SPO11 [Neolecta irregularis DAH-3]|uniref:DNA topoisomerase (ATP-hydrolyzing) n=1 Tax=Neolecta irregularis (strain DAH-3) TaxID=1198029 RepID=A0A1U7LMP2_NEOID|nr:Meiotic recombination protein SPO11 [Neolecta irregularis DAH-3]|eukprot:OLL23940.1 Meiotic recombination protein SPO11 [Neolecta irregularis DAH-3]
MLRVLQLIHEGLVKNEKSTKRDLYYKDAKLFRSQSVVDELVDDIAFTFSVARSALNVTAASKGLVAGGLTIHKKNGAIDDCSDFPEGLLIPNVADIKTLEINADYVLVIEKEASFQSLCLERFHSHPEIGNAILITLRPIPTREFLRLLANSTTLSQSAYTRSTPIFCLVDNDPHGFEIFSTYKFGSKSLAHENRNLTLPSLQWIGVFAKDFDGVKNGLDGYMPLTIRDRQKATSLLQNSWLDGEIEMKSDLCRMLFVGMKAEIQAMCEANKGGLVGYLVDKIREKREM